MCHTESLLKEHAENGGTNCSHVCQADEGGEGQSCTTSCLQTKQRGILHPDSQADPNGTATVRDVLNESTPLGKPIAPSIIIPIDVPVKEHHPVILEI